MHLGTISMVGIVSMPVYYFVVDFFIKKQNIATPGRNGNLTGVSTGNDDDESSAKAPKGKVAPK
jgi:PTS system glucose-specific IIC component